MLLTETEVGKYHYLYVIRDSQVISRVLFLWNFTIVRINTSWAEQNSRHFADDIFQCSCLRESFDILIRTSLNFVPDSLIVCELAMGQAIRFWRQTEIKLFQRTHVVMITSLSFQNNVTRSFVRNNDVTLLLRHVSTGMHYMGRWLPIYLTDICVTRSLCVKVFCCNSPWFSTVVYMLNCLQSSFPITQLFSPKHSRMTVHSSPVWASYGVSFVSS